MGAYQHASGSFAWRADASIARIDVNSDLKAAYEEVRSGKGVVIIRGLPVDGTLEAFTQRIATMRDTYVERMWDPTVLVRGPMAVVWAPYDIHRNREFMHCGVDSFTLFRSATGWNSWLPGRSAMKPVRKPSPIAMSQPSPW